MNVEFKFNIKQKVTIPEINRPGIVTGLMVGDENELQYRVRYFDDGTAKTVWFHDFEIQASA